MWALKGQSCFHNRRLEILISSSRAEKFVYYFFHDAYSCVFPAAKAQLQQLAAKFSNITSFSDGWRRPVISTVLGRLHHARARSTAAVHRRRRTSSRCRRCRLEMARSALDVQNRLNVYVAWQGWQTTFRDNELREAEWTCHRLTCSDDNHNIIVILTPIRLKCSGQWYQRTFFCVKQGIKYYSYINH